MFNCARSPSVRSPDTLDGGGGKDTYVFKDPPGSGIDTIVRFQTGEKLKIAKGDFSGLTMGQLSADQFVKGTEAEDGNDRFIYDPSAVRSITTRTEPVARQRRSSP